MVQQIQPLVSSTMSCSTVTKNWLSILISPNSFTSTATRKASKFCKMWFSKVVLPLPKKPVMMVTGRRVSGGLGCMGGGGVGGVGVEE